jgi:hypothetical protein
MRFPVHGVFLMLFTTRILVEPTGHAPAGKMRAWCSGDEGSAYAMRLNNQDRAGP